MYGKLSLELWFGQFHFLQNIVGFNIETSVIRSIHSTHSLFFSHVFVSSCVVLSLGSVFSWTISFLKLGCWLIPTSL